MCNTLDRSHPRQQFSITLPVPYNALSSHPKSAQNIGDESS